MQWIDNNDAFDALVDDLSRESVYGIDTEFHRERTYYAELALIQLSWGDRIALVDPLAVDVAKLARVFKGDSLCILHASSQDLEILHYACGCVPTQLFDTQIAGLFLGRGNASLGKLLKHFLDVELDKGAQLADWLARPLEEAALNYAAADVAHLLALHRTMIEALEASGRRPWAEEEMARVRDKSWEPTPPERAWWKLRGKGKIAPKLQGVAQSLAMWRESTARAENRPLRWVLSDVALLSIVQRPPKDRRALNRVRGVDQRHMKYASQILNAIAEGRAMATEAIQRPPMPTSRAPRPLVSLCLAYLQQRADQEQIDPAMLASRAELEAFVHEPTTGRLATGWRYRLLGADLRDLVAGKKALTADNEGGLTLLNMTND